MRFNEALRKVTLDFKQKFLGECLNGYHCPVGVGPGLIPHPLDPAGGMHTGWWDHSATRHVAGVDPITHPQLTGVTFGQHHSHYARMIWDIFSYGPISTALTILATRMLLTPIQITERCIVDRIGDCIVVAAGSQRMAIYQDNGDQPDGGALIAETASVAAVAYKNELAITDQVLNPGLYWLAHQNSDGTLQAQCPYSMISRGGTLNGRGWNMAYGAFPNPCPTPTIITAIDPVCMYLRVSSVG